MSIKPLTKSPWNIQISVGAATEPVKAYHTTSSQTASFFKHADLCVTIQTITEVLR